MISDTLKDEKLELLENLVDDKNLLQETAEVKST